MRITDWIAGLKRSVAVVGVLFCMQVLFAADDPQDVLQLLGSIAGKRGGGVALVKHRPTGAIKAIRTGEAVYEFGSLVSVDRYSMVIKSSTGQMISVSSKFGGASKRAVARKGALVNNGAEYVEEGFARRVGKNGNVQVEVEERYKKKVLANELPTIMMQAASEPVIENGVIQGFRLFQFEQDSMFQKLGIQEGDIIKEINDVPLNNVAKTVQFLNTLKSASNVRVVVIRDGRPMNIELNVK